MQRMNTYGAPMDWSGEISRVPDRGRVQANSRERGMEMTTANPPELVDMQNNLPAEVVQSPVSREEAYLGSWKALLSRY